MKKADKSIREKTKLRVLHISPGFTGGIATHINNIVLGIDQEKLIIDVAAFPADKKDAKAFIDDVYAKKGRVFDLLSPKGSPWRFYKQLVNIIKKNGPYEAVHIHLHGYRFVVISMIVRSAGAKRIISHAHIADGKDSQKLISKIQQQLSINMTRLFATQYASCSKIASYYVFGKKAVNKLKVMHIPNGVDTRKYDIMLSADQERKLKKQGNIGNNSLIIGHVGYFRYQKNHPFMVQIIKELAQAGEDFIWLFVGTGHDMDAIKTMVAEEHLQKYVRFLGYRNDIPKLLKLMDILVLPSHFEGLPTVAIEAQAAGTPCLLSSNVSSETDLNIDLCYFMPLNSSIPLWCTRIKEIASLKGKTNINIKNRLEEKCFTTSTAAKLYERFIYNEILHYEF